MTSDTVAACIELLKGGYALSDREKRERVRELGVQGLKVLRDIALGQVPTEHPKLRLKAIAALSYDTDGADASRAVLASLLTDQDPRIALQAARSFEEMPPGRHLGSLIELMGEPHTPAPVALATARVVAKHGGPGVVPELQDLRIRLLPLLDDNQQSPSIIALDRLIDRARGGAAIVEDRPKVV